jgi:hypothetical protein
MSKLIASFALLAFAVSGYAQKPPDEFLGDEHMREELGVNPFTAPSIELILKTLDELKPLPYDKLARAIPNRPPQKREQLALSFGGLIADGFLIVECEQKEEVEPLGRAVLDFARGLAVAEKLTRRSKSLVDLSKAGNWKKMKEELASAQIEVEDAMVALRDEEIAHLVSLGGWLRGLEISAEAISDQPFSAEKAARIFRLDLLDYFLERLDTLHPATKRMPLITRIIDQLGVLRTIFSLPDGKSLTAADVHEIARLAQNLN